jgi:hypothetical protein
MTGPSLKLLVLKTPQVDRLRAFYLALGIELAEEQHGTGPVRYAGQTGNAVLEIYPLPGEGGAWTRPRGWASWCRGWPNSTALRRAI